MAMGFHYFNLGFAAISALAKNYYNDVPKAVQIYCRQRIFQVLFL
jgi:hypothetical protein